jgi:K+-transporting ATPase ATPase C chain
MRVIIQAVRVAAVTLVLTGLLYPLLMTGLAQLLFSHRAEGSLVVDEKGVVVGSELVAQAFTAPGYLQPRPSAAGDKGYDPLASGGSNLGPTSTKLRQRVAEDVKRLRAENPEAPPAVPAELVTTSASGLDPHLTPGAAAWQAHRIAAARGVAQQRILDVLEEATEGRDLGFLGEPRVNVLTANLALDRRFGRLVLPPAPPAPAPAPAAAPAGQATP